MSTEIAKREFNTQLAKVTDSYMGMITSQLESNKVDFNEYAKRCVINAVGAINNALESAGVNWNDEQLDKSNVGQILLNVASLELNSAAQPSELFFQVRNVKKKDGSWGKKIELGVQGAGNDALLARFGRDVTKVYPTWEVREGDDFTYPSYNGVQMDPPKWTPKGHGDIVRIVIPVLHKDNSLHYYIGERDEVKKNLLAHINNNLMNETFGIAKDRYSATLEQSKKIDKKKAELKAKAKQIGFDALDDEELSQYISPAWKEDFSRESMILRKMKNNVAKRIPKDFGSSFVQSNYMEATDEEYANAKADIIENTASIAIPCSAQEIEVAAEAVNEEEIQMTIADIPSVFAE